MPTIGRHWQLSSCQPSRPGANRDAGFSPEGRAVGPATIYLSMRPMLVGRKHRRRGSGHGPAVSAGSGGCGDLHLIGLSRTRRTAAEHG